MKRLILSSLNKLNSAQLTVQERDAVIKELRSNHFRISEVSEAMKLSKGRISQIEHGYKCANTPFSFYRWLEESKEINKSDIPLTEHQERLVKELILKLSRIAKIRIRE